MDARGEGECRVRVPEVVEPDALELRRLRVTPEHFGEGVWVQPSAVRLREDEVRVLFAPAVAPDGKRISNGQADGASGESRARARIVSSGSSPRGSVESGGR